MGKYKNRKDEKLCNVPLALIIAIGVRLGTKKPVKKDKSNSFRYEYFLFRFRGRSCTPRCKNSIGILRRQRKARRLEECTCGPGEFLFDSSDSSSGLVLERRFGCAQVKENMEKLCKEDEEEEEEEEVLDDNNEVEEEVVGSGSSKRTGGVMTVFSILAAAAAALAVIFS